MNRLISVVIPVYNEEKCLKELHGKLLDVLNKTGESFEIIYIDDGSTDNSKKNLDLLSPARILHLKRNYGQTIALDVGIKSAKGDLIITIDSDLENRPEDIPAFIAKIDEGFDIVSGWRKNRWSNSPLMRKIPSKAANWLISRLSGVKIHDFGCTLKVYRKEMFENISFSGGMHRLLLAYMGRRGAKIAEIEANFVPRRWGASKYGIKRTFDVLIDIFAFYFFEKFHNRPIHFFGIAGFSFFVLSALTFGLMIFYKFFAGLTFVQTPLPVLAVFFAITGFQFAMMGLIAELIHRYTKENRTNSKNNHVKTEILNS